MTTQNRERIYGTRGDFKLVARDVVKGPDGYDFRTCGSKATKQQQEAVAAHNRAEVALLMEKSAFVFEVRRNVVLHVKLTNPLLTRIRATARQRVHCTNTPASRQLSKELSSTVCFRTGCSIPSSLTTRCPRTATRMMRCSHPTSRPSRWSPLTLPSTL